MTRVITSDASEGARQKAGFPVRTNLHRNLIAGIALMVALLAVGAAFNYRSIKRLSENSELVAHTLEVDRVAADLMRLTTDAVVSQRGYLLSGDASFLDVYRTTIAVLPERREELRDLTRDNQHQQDRLRQMESGLDELVDSLDSGITLRDQGLDAAEAVVAAKSARIRLEGIRDVFESLRAEERRLLTERESQMRDAYQGALYGGVLSLVLGLALFAGIVELARRNLAATQEHQSRLPTEREQLQVTLSSIGDAVIATDKTGRITQFNRVAEKLTGWSQKEALSQPAYAVLQLQDDNTGQSQANLIDRVLVSGQAVEHAEGTELIARDQHRRTVSGNAAPIRATDGSLQGVVLTLRDVTVERAARQGEAARARLVALRADIGMLISTSGNTRETLQQCAAEITRRLPADAVGIWESDSESEPLKLLAAAGPAAKSAPSTLPMSAADELLRRVASTRSKTASLELRRHVQGDGRGRRVGFPLVVEDRLIGVLIVSIPETADESTEEELEPLAAKLAQYIDRRRIEEARQQSEQMFRTLANSIPQLAWMARPDGYIFWYNQRWFDFTGTTLEDMQGWGWQSVHDPEELPKVLKTIKHSFATGEPWEHTFPLRRHDGVFRWHLSRMLPVHDDSGRVVLWFGTNTDITEQREVTQALKRSEAFAHGVVNSSPDCLKILDLDGRLQWMNDAGRQLMQVCDFDSLKGSDWASFWSDSEACNHVQQAIGTARGGGTGRFQGFCPTTQGEPRWWDVAISPIAGPDELPEQLLVVSRDITKQRASDEEIRLANLRKDEFLALLAHELRNPLSALTAGTQLIVLHPEDTPQVTESGELILRQCFQLKQLVDDLLDVSRISRGKLNLQRQPVALREVIGNAVETARPVIQSAHHQLKIELCDEDLYVSGDAVRLSQVISNLLINAAKYTPSGGRIDLRLDQSGGLAVVCVKDNGIGIPSDKLESIFELFTQVDTSHTRSQGGLGIGLTLAQTLVQLHDGSLKVASAGENQGSTFTVEIPLIKLSDSERQSLGTSVQVSDSDLPHRRILAVDDNRAAVHLLSRLLGRLGQDVHVATSGQAALGEVQSFQPEIVISDIAMPDITGYELAKQIRSQPLGEQILLVALTGYGQESDRQAAIDAGFDQHLTKPVSLDQLRTLLMQFRPLD